MDDSHFVIILRCKFLKRAFSEEVLTEEISSSVGAKCVSDITITTSGFRDNA